MELDVYLNTERIGRLWKDGRRSIHFQYAPEWVQRSDAIPLSISLPLQEQAFSGNVVHHFFANVLPEGDIRERIAGKLGLSKDNVFGLLQALGGDCAGAIAVYPAGTHPPEGKDSYQSLTEDDLAKVVRELPRKPLLAGEEGIRLSLAGAQDKLPVRFDGQQIFLPLKGSPSTHILKPPMQRIKGSVVNEAFCMRLAAAVGLEVPIVSLLRTGEVYSLLVQRYDRRIEGDSIIRLHQEDFCQALGVSPGIKYEFEGGPGFKDCFSVVRKHSSSPARDIKRLTEWCFFNAAIGNADAHAKNISLIYSQGKAPILAPHYDLICTAIYEELSDRMAMRIGGENRLVWIMKRHWERFAEEAGAKKKVVVANAAAFCESIATWIDPTLEGFLAEYKDAGGEFAEQVAEFIRKNIEGLLKRLG